MKRLYFSVITILSFFLLSYNIFPVNCPPLNCPADRDLPLAEYLFENNLNDSSGNSLNAGDNYPPNPVNYYLNIGGMPGYSVDNFAFGSMTGVTVPACVFYSSTGEVDWYQYVTATNPTISNCSINLVNTDNTGISIYSGDTDAGEPTFIRVSYTYWNGTGISGANYSGAWLKLNTWQYLSFQWDTWGTRLLIDGVIKAGSFNQLYLGNQWSEYFRLGTNGTDHGFYGYIADVTFWPCSSHGTMTQTPTYTPGTAFTLTISPTITVTLTQTPSSTITPTFTDTSSITETYTITQTFTITPSFTISPTFTFTPTISPTITLTPTLIYNGFNFIGVFPSPANRTTNFIFVCYENCNVKISLYTVSGEKITDISTQGQYGVNNITYDLTNSSGRPIASGIYIYKIEMSTISGNKKMQLGKLAVIK